MTIPLEKLKPGVLVRTTTTLWADLAYNIRKGTTMLLLEVNLPKTVTVLLHNGEVHTLRTGYHETALEASSWFEEV